MNKEEFCTYLKEHDFTNLFLASGWNKPKARFPLSITIGTEDNKKTFSFKEVAERYARVYVCECDSLPRASEHAALDARLRKQNAEGYISIFVDKTKPFSQRWVVPVNLVDKRTLVKISYETEDQTSCALEKMGKIDFGLGNELNATDVLEKINTAFATNALEVTKKFYTEFKEEHSKFVEGILNIVNDKDRDWYASVMLNRLMFCYFIQKKGFLGANINYLRKKLDEVKEKRGKDKFYGTFYRAFLRVLFADGLNNPRHSSKFKIDFGQIPYLNGGMFDEHELEKKYNDIDIPDEIFDRLFEFFDKWNWHLDTSVTAKGEDINPDVLGYIFEQYINDRAAMGAYYTKEDITDYIGKNCIIPFLFDKLSATSSAKAMKAGGEVWTFLRDNGNKYIYNAVKKGWSKDWREKIPAEIAKGLDTSAPNLLERRAEWNRVTDAPFALPTEIWRETIERFTRCDNVMAKIEKGEITSINDFITYNLNIRAFTYDLLSETDDHLLVSHFYKELRSVTILDPTCGSGAFLFAALNILEPLYEVCIDRMENFHEKNKNLFKDELLEIESKYRSNIQYFIYKNIILRNLYGVDIMVEATEIAKLRLFLKMVAVVDADESLPNLGLDPLPDIDFNIRCGNTLVGYATEKELKDSLTYGDMFEIAEFKDRVTRDMETVAAAYRQFKDLQMTQESENMAAFKKAKSDLRERLATLNDTLNARLYGKEPDRGYASWLASHQPFHWLAEFYEIIHDRGGFDVIIGNPPYVEYTKKDKKSGKAISDYYKLKDATAGGYKTLPCGNLYAFVIERSLRILNSKTLGMIIPTSSISTERMKPLQSLLFDFVGIYYSTFGFRPGKLFDGGTSANLHLSILITNTKSYNHYATHHIKWNSEYRPFLFSTLLNYSPDTATLLEKYKKVIRSKNEVENSILAKIFTTSSMEKFAIGTDCVYYRSTGGLHYRVFSLFPTYSKKESSIGFVNLECAKLSFCIFASNLWNMFYYSVANCLDVSRFEIYKFPIDYGEMSGKVKTALEKLSKKLANDIRKHSSVMIRTYQGAGDVECPHINMRHSKPIIDEIDKVLAEHYGFTEEELDFIINYDVKYRMGDALDAGE